MNIYTVSFADFTYIRSTRHQYHEYFGHKMQTNALILDQNQIHIELCTKQRDSKFRSFVFTLEILTKFYCCLKYILADK